MESDGLRELLLTLADDELMIGHRHSEWTGWAPHIEEDIAFSSIAQDEIGHASLFYQLVSAIDGRSADALALGRSPQEYRCAHICEHPNVDWAYTLARHFLYDLAERVRLTSLLTSSHEPLAAAATKILREERYHELHADAWLKRAAASLDGRHEIAAALASAIPLASGLFEPFEGQADALAQGWLPEPTETLRERWMGEVTEHLDALGITAQTVHDEADVLPSSSGTLIENEETSSRLPAGSAAGGRRGQRTADFEALWDELTRTYREEPSATW